MKKILFFTIAMLLFSGCNIKNQRQKNQGRQDSIVMVEIRKQEVKDSLERTRIDSLALIAWGDAKFGMSQKKYYQLIPLRSLLYIPKKPYQ